MNDALKLLNNGEAVFIKASRLTEKDKAFDYICPDCKTMVDLRLGDDRKYFAHHKNEIKRLNRENCPRYLNVEGYASSYYDISNVTGYPLVLDERNNKLKLNILLPQIHKTDIGNLPGIIRKIRLYNSNNKDTFIDIDYLLSGDIMCPLDFSAYDYYRCEFTDDNGVAISKKSSSILRDTIGIDRMRGSVFHDYVNGVCKRLPEGSQAVVGTSYYHLTHSNVSVMPEGIVHKEVGSIILASSQYSNSRWWVNRIRANVADKHTCLFFRNLGIELVEKTSQLCLLWPPCPPSGTSARVNKDCQCFLSFKNYSKLNEPIIQTNQVGSRRTTLNPINVNDEFSLVKTNAFSGKAHIQIRGLMTPSEIEITNNAVLLENEINESEMRLDYKDGNRLSQDQSELLADTIKHNGNTRPEIIQIRNAIVYRVDNKRISKLWESDHLVLNNRAWGIIEYSFGGQKDKDAIIIDDNINNLFEEIIRVSNVSLQTTIDVPNWVKEVIWQLRRRPNTNNKLNVLFNKWLRTNSLPITILPHFKRLSKHFGGKNNV